MDIKRAYRDFRRALGKVAPILPPVHQYAITKCTTEAEQQKQLHEVEEIARHYFRDLEANKKHHHAAFLAQGDQKNDQQGQQDQQKGKGKTSFQGKDIKIPTCICGKQYWYANCYYLNPSKAPSQWKEDPATRKRVNDDLDAHPAKRTKISESIQRDKDIKGYWAKQKDKDSSIEQGNQGEESQEAKSKKNKGHFVVKSTKYKVQSGISGPDSLSLAIADDFDLHSSWLFDGGSGDHVCNKTMQHRFIKDRDCTDGTELISGCNRMQVQSYGSININVIAPEGEAEITLHNV
ncbi:MAG: hypothetical protein Q9203_007520, partial [Teloschistes exilis]